MNAKVKICGLSTAPTLDKAVAMGVDLVGFVFYRPSPRYVTPDQARELAARVPGGIAKVALVVDMDNDELDEIVEALDPDMIQAHGHETPARVNEIKSRYNRPVIKAISVADAADFERARAYDEAADMILFDAKPPKSMNNPLPGGNGLAFDWELIAGRNEIGDFILSGGLDPDNVAAAIELTNPAIVDVSSGVETAPGKKDETLIAKFLENAKKEPRQ
jgi:phosphoribosylanthranilate isomerase